MAERPKIKWPTCEEAGCIGVRLASARLCLAHAGEEELAAALKLVGETGTVDARGVPITGALLERILTAAPRGKNDEPLLKDCEFDRATFGSDTSFRRTIFNSAVSFSGVTFNSYGDFRQTTFNGAAWFGNVTFSRAAGFDEATFSDTAWFAGSTFGGADFGKATFSGAAWFIGATVNGSTRFEDATFSDVAHFGGATFNGVTELGMATFSDAAQFEDTTFSGDTGFEGATFSGAARFEGASFLARAGFASARFEQARQFGPLLAYQELELDDVQFMQPVQIEVSSTGVSCHRARFPGGVQFRLRWACVILDDTDLAAPSILAGIPRLSNEKLARREEQIARTWQQELASEISERPQLMSLRRANVAGLGLSNVSAADCRFVGAHNLDKLRLESDVSFATAPVLVGSGGREVIAEERAWRTDSRHATRSRLNWVAPGWPVWPGWIEYQRPGVLDPGQIAGLYRALRKGREDIKDEPGAADFYYGEMEMRRARPLSGQSGAASRGRVERSILTAYWLVSGYGLRAWRAVAWLVIVTGFLAAAFHLVGFAVPPRPVSYWTSLLYAFRATLSLTDDQVKLTAWGQLLQGVLRLTGPVLLGLALLALRGRIKR